MTTNYHLNAADDYLTVTTAYRNTGNAAISVTLEDDFRADGGKEVMPRTPNGTKDTFWLHDRFWGQAYALDVEGRKIQINSDAKNSQLKYVDDAGEAKVSFAAWRIDHAHAADLRGEQPCDTLAAQKRRNKAAVTPVNLEFSNSKHTPLRRARVEFNSLDSRYGSATTDEHGRIQTALPSG